jgi:hypothetical protein
MVDGAGVMHTGTLSDKAVQAKPIKKPALKTSDWN